MSEARLDAVSEFDGAASLLRARLGVTAIFFANGLGIGAWRSPSLRSRRCSPFPTLDCR